MALRGDPPKGDALFTPAPDGLRHADELVGLIKARHADFCLGVAGYPEKHPEAASFEDDLANLRRKVDMGAAFVTTQLFFDNEAYFQFADRCRESGITVPVLAGIMPVVSLKHVERFGAKVPARLLDRLNEAGSNPEAVERAGVDWALAQIDGLLAGGAPGVHLYILNRARGARALMNAFD
jgi:methylenetetrahydrofolate reductase (NADPH)